MELRDFMKKATLGAVVVLITLQLSSCGEIGKADNETLRDKLWMWGHEPEVIMGTANIPVGNNIGMVDAINFMGIPNVCAINHGDFVKLPYEDEYIEQFKNVKNVAWSLMSGPEWSPQYDKIRKFTYDQLIKEGFRLMDKMPNLNEFYLDDFFDYMAPPDETTGLAKSHMSIDQLKELKSNIQNLKRQPKLTMVLYTHQLNPSIKPYFEYIDRVSLWTWWGSDLSILEDNFRKYRELIPDKPTLLGIYMWDFGNEKPIPVEDMKVQLDFAYEKLKTGEIEGMIFHCTPLVNKNLKAVEYAKEWISKHGNEKR